MNIPPLSDQPQQDGFRLQSDGPPRPVGAPRGIRRSARSRQPLPRPPRRRRGGALTRMAAAAVLSCSVALSGCFAMTMPTEAKSTSKADPGKKSDDKGAETPTEAPKATSVTIPVMLVSGGTGEGKVGSATVSIAQGSEAGMTVEVAESEVRGIGDSFRAAAWNAVIVATLLSGAPVDSDYRFEMHGMVDGTSAGGVTTVALLSLIHGDELADDVAMTGTIAANGTIGPVGGIPEKVKAIADDGRFTKALIPLGSRNSPNLRGKLVDVVRLGRKEGIEVVEVGDVTHAYEEFTGAQLKAGAAPRPSIDEDGYARLETATQKQITAFIDSETRFLALSGLVQDFGWSMYEDAAADIQQARKLLDQGLPGGAFVKAVNAQVLMSSVAKAFSTLDSALIKQDPSVITRALDVAGNTESKIVNYITELNSFEVATLADAEALATSYGNGFDALTVYQFAMPYVSHTRKLIRNGAPFEELIGEAVQPLLFLEIAGAQVAAADAIFDIGRGLEGPAIDASVDAEALGTFLRRASEANLEVFDSVVLQGLAEDAGISMDIARKRLGNRDVTVELAYTGKNNIHAVTEFMGDDNPNAAYAMIGHGWLNFARNAGLVDKYYNNGIIDPSTFEIVGVRSDPLLMHTLDWTRDQLSTAVDALESKDYSPALIVGAFESDSLGREGDVQKKFESISGFTGSYAMARVLAYLGGFAAE